MQNIFSCIFCTVVLWFCLLRTPIFIIFSHSIFPHSVPFSIVTFLLEQLLKAKISFNLLGVPKKRYRFSNNTLQKFSVTNQCFNIFDDSTLNLKPRNRNIYFCSLIPSINKCSVVWYWQNTTIQNTHNFSPLCAAGWA